MWLTRPDGLDGNVVASAADLGLREMGKLP
jgi:hypothetical protein